MVIGVATFDSRLITFLRCWRIMAEKRCCLGSNTQIKAMSKKVIFGILLLLLLTLNQNFFCQFYTHEIKKLHPHQLNSLLSAYHALNGAMSL